MVGTSSESNQESIFEGAIALPNVTVPLRTSERRTDRFKLVVSDHPKHH
ncbi:MAG: hypothetical protein VKL39_07195 [Leptolyngbyaceae bacterium]|nr:hypothetical protein [Leptolyngbyaceae bacterium]